jgi:hypothetical protein
MAINIAVGSGEEEKETQRTVSLKANKTLSGDIIIHDHPELQIIVSRAKNKIIAYPKLETGDRTYYSQEDLFSFLADKGVVGHDAMQGGVLFGSMEALILKPKEGSTIDPIQVVLSKIYDYMQLEEPNFALQQKFEDNEGDRLLDPDVNTELGDVPQYEKKGSMDPRFARRYYITYHF